MCWLAFYENHNLFIHIDHISYSTKIAKNISLRKLLTKVRKKLSPEKPKK